MTPTETVMLTRYVQACCPHQAIDEYTPDAWHDILGHLALADCRAAVVAIKQRARYVDPCDIIAEVKRNRAVAIVHERHEALVAPLRRRQLDDPRPLRSEIESLVAEHWPAHRELTAGSEQTEAS